VKAGARRRCPPDRAERHLGHVRERPLHAASGARTRR
jgi:hypothetical protein